MRSRRIKGRGSGKGTSSTPPPTPLFFFPSSLLPPQPPPLYMPATQATFWPVLEPCRVTQCANLKIQIYSTTRSPCLHVAKLPVIRGSYIHKVQINWTVQRLYFCRWSQFLYSKRNHQNHSNHNLGLLFHVVFTMSNKYKTLKQYYPLKTVRGITFELNVFL